MNPVVVVDPPRTDPALVAGLGEVVVHPGDAVIADDDGVVCVPRALALQVAAEGGRRVQREDEARQAFTQGELGLDRYGLRPVLDRPGVRYAPAQPGEWPE